MQPSSFYLAASITLSRACNLRLLHYPHFGPVIFVEKRCLENISFNDSSDFHRCRSLTQGEKLVSISIFPSLNRGIQCQKNTGNGIVLDVFGYRYLRAPGQSTLP